MPPEFDDLNKSGLLDAREARAIFDSTEAYYGIPAGSIAGLVRITGHERDGRLFGSTTGVLYKPHEQQSMLINGQEQPISYLKGLMEIPAETEVYCVRYIGQGSFIEPDTIVYRSGNKLVFCELYGPRDTFHGTLFYSIGDLENRAELPLHSNLFSWTTEIPIQKDGFFATMGKRLRKNVGDNARIGNARAVSLSGCVVPGVTEDRWALVGRLKTKGAQLLPIFTAQS